MLTDQSKRRMAAVAMFLAPVGIVWGAGNFLGGPVIVEASGLAPAILDPGMIPRAGVTAVTPAQREASSRVLELRDAGFGPTPLYHTENGRVVEPTNAGVPPVPQVSVGMILASSKGNFAMIDGERYRVGEELGDTGWTIIEINADERSVTIDDREYDRTRKFFVDSPTGINIRTSPAGSRGERRPAVPMGEGDPPAPEAAEDDGHAVDLDEDADVEEDS